jgi:D-alanine-D-alanine ligase
MKRHKNKNPKQAYGKVAVLMGGDSAEREISLEKGQSVLAALRRLGIDAHPFDTRKRKLAELAAGGYSRAFIALHGRGGEDGVIQGALQAMNIPYTGSGVLGSALSMDKVRSKHIWRAAALPTPDFLEITGPSDIADIKSKLGFPVMVKPVHEGSSCGATKVKKAEALQGAWDKARALDERVMAERWITGREYTAAVLGRTVLPMIRLETPREFFDYEAKYVADTTRYICPCGLPKQREGKLAALILAAFDMVGASGWARVDFIIDAKGQPWLIEINTVPGMTSHSLVPMAARQAGIEFDALVETILKTSLNRVSGADP